MTRPHEHAALAGDQGKDVARPHEIAGAHIAVGERPHRIAALLGGNSGRQAVADIHGDGEGCPERRVVGGDHRRQMQPAGVLERQRRADDAAAMADDEGDLLGRRGAGGHHEVALVFPVVVVGHDDDLATADRLDGLGDAARARRAVALGADFLRGVGVEIFGDRPDLPLLQFAATLKQACHLRPVDAQRGGETRLRLARLPEPFPNPADNDFV